MKTVRQTLRVYWNRDIAGELWNDDQDLLHFNYAEAWITHAPAQGDSLKMNTL